MKINYLNAAAIFGFLWVASKVMAAGPRLEEARNRSAYMSGFTNMADRLAESHHKPDHLGRV